VSVTHGNAVVCVGGSDSKRHYSDAFRIEWIDGKIVTTTLPPLPMTIANACGALVGNVLYIGGGQEKPDSTETLKTLYCMDLAVKEPKWEELEACPGGGRMLSVAASFDGAFWMVGGVDLVAGKDGKAERRYLKDAYRYDPAKGWTRIADLPRFVTAAPSPAPNDATGFDILGGDDASQLSVAPNDHKGFSKTILRYDAKTEKWIEAGEVTASRVTVPCVRWEKLWVIPSGEAKPGVRSPEVWAK
jgi:N-acetylneuraminic acid mutarotase